VAVTHSSIQKSPLKPQVPVALPPTDKPQYFMTVQQDRAAPRPQVTVSIHEYRAEGHWVGSVYAQSFSCSRDAAMRSCEALNFTFRFLDSKPS